MRSMMTTLLTSLGTPMIVAGTNPADAARQQQRLLPG
jgi:hypothetical protein